MNESPFINIGELSRPANTLIEKISDAIGGIFKPYQIKRIAKAEAEANLINAQNQVEIDELKHRAMHRFIEEETKKQENIESITAQAIPLLDDNAQSENIEDDWITNFFDKCRLISDKQMQELWSKVLAGEANQPNSYSKRTINLLSSLDKKDATLFNNLCIYKWDLGGGTPIVFDSLGDIYTKNGITFKALQHLDSIGLISLNSISGYRKINLPKFFLTIYYGKQYVMEFKKEKDNELQIGNVLLTQAGEELSMICNSEPDNDFLNYSIKVWKKKGVKIAQQIILNR